MTDSPMFDKNQTIVICRGIPACGKTTYARSLIGFKRVNRDDLRAMIDNSVWSKENEQDIRALRDIIITRYLEGGYNVVVDDTNIPEKAVEELRQVALGCNPHIQVKVETFDVPLEECLRRNSMRTGITRVPVEVIQRFHKQLHENPSIKRTDSSSSIDA